MTGSHATDGEIGGGAVVTGAKTQDHSLATCGAAGAFKDRTELSVARQDLETMNKLAPLGLPGLHLKQDIFGVKQRVARDAVLDSDTLMPQIVVDLQHERVDAGALGTTLFGPRGAGDSGTDLYVSATKLFLAPGILVDGTLGATKAKQHGQLGFGGAQSLSD